MGRSRELPCHFSFPRCAPAPAHTHDEYEASELRVESGTPPDELEARLRSLGVLRAKGFVRTPDGTRVVQVVGSRFALEVPPGAVADELLDRIVIVRRADG